MDYYYVVLTYFFLIAYEAEEIALLLGLEFLFSFFFLLGLGIEVYICSSLVKIYINNFTNF